MVRNYVTAALFIIFLSACAVPHKQLDNNPAFTTHQYNSADMDISWKSEKVDNGLSITGTVTNVRVNTTYENVELEATLFDAQKNILAKNTYNFSPLELKGTEAFKMMIPLKKEAVPERVKFNYRYGVEEDRYSIKFESRL